MKNRAIAGFAVVLMMCLMPLAGLALTPYSQDFEGLNQTNPYALANDNWLIYGNVWSADGEDLLYWYGPFDAPNDGYGFCQVALGEGGVEQGEQQLSVFSDYNNADHGNGLLIESNTFQEQIVGPENVGEKWVFQFDAKLGNLEGSSTAVAFIKTLDPGAGYAMTNFRTRKMTHIPDTWSTYLLAIDIDAGLDGQILQIGFMTTASNYEGSAVIYDNIEFRSFDGTDVPAWSPARDATLRQNYPNPFNPATVIEFALDRPQLVEISVFDLAGRMITTLHHGELGAGDHTVTWNGRTAAGSPAPAGQYRYVLRTPTGQVSRSMVLLK